MLNQRCRQKVIAVLIVLLASLPVAASAGPVDPTASLTVKEAVAYAMDHNKNVLLLELAVEKARVGLAEARDAAKKFDEEDVSTLDAARLKHVAPVQAESELDIARSQLDATRSATRLAVEKSYYDVLRAREALEVARESVRLAENQKKLAESNLRAGTAARNDVLAAEVALVARRTEAENAESACQITGWKFNRTLGLPLDEEIRLTEDPGFEEFRGPEEQEALAQALATQPELVAARGNAVVAKNDFTQVKRFYTPNVYEYRQVQYTLAAAGIKAAEAEQEIFLRVKVAYRNLSMARTGYTALVKSMELAEENLELAEARYRGGVATLMEVQDASLTLRQVRMQALEALHLYRVTGAQLEAGVFSAQVDN